MRSTRALAATSAAIFVSTGLMIAQSTDARADDVSNVAAEIGKLHGIEAETVLKVMRELGIQKEVLGTRLSGAEKRNLTLDNLRVGVKAGVGNVPM